MNELIDLYTVDRQYLGKTIEREEVQPAGTYRLIVHTCIFDTMHRMLIQKRSHSKSLWPGYWDISAGGAVCAGETSRKAAERETFEELGLALDLTDRRPVISVSFEAGFDDFYTIEIEEDDADFILQNEEVTDMKWVDADEILTMINDGSFIPYDKELIQYLFIAREGEGSWNL